ncbi:MAG: hypothetical protein M1819_003069 [Sarea resinae]|nr:MAG: hypothetical protein M1819_003069 [Sarea resinae]
MQVKLSSFPTGFPKVLGLQAVSQSGYSKADWLASSIELPRAMDYYTFNTYPYLSIPATYPSSVDTATDASPPYGHVYPFALTGQAFAALPQQYYTLPSPGEMSWPPSSDQLPVEAAPLLEESTPDHSRAFAPALTLVNTPPLKRARRSYQDIDRIYVCGYKGCEKSYGDLSHLNTHVKNVRHGEKRRPEGTQLFLFVLFSPSASNCFRLSILHHSDIKSNTEFKALREERKLRQRQQREAHERLNAETVSAAAAARNLAAYSASSPSDMSTSVGSKRTLSESSGWSSL